MTERQQPRVYNSSAVVAAAFLVLLLSVSAKAEDLDCPYLYTEQLNHFPTCSPYIGGVMELECTVEAPLNATDITIGWFLNCEQLQDGSNVLIEGQVDINNTRNIRRIRSRLTINDITNDFAGTYTCNILGDEEYIPSEPLTLSDSTQLDVHQALGPCVDGDVFGNAEGQTNEKCAVISENRTIPMSLSCDEPPATSSHDIPVTSTPVVYTTPLPSLPTATTSSSSSSQRTLPPFPKSPTPTLAIPAITDPSDRPTSAPAASIWLYVVVAVAAVFFMIIVVLSIVFVGMCLKRSRSLTLDEQTLKHQVQGKQLNGMNCSTPYQGDADSTFPASSLPNSHPSPHSSSPTDYNTLGTADYEIVGPGGDYQRLHHHTFTASMKTRSVVSPLARTSATTASAYPLSATLNDPIGMSRGAANGVVPPPPLPNSFQRAKLPNSPGSSDSAFHTGSPDIMCSPSERDRFDSTSMLLPKDGKGSAVTMFEGLYSPVGQQCGVSPGSPRINHPLEKIPETGASFPEPRNPYPFPTSSCSCRYESISGKESNKSPARDKRGHPHAVTLPAGSPPHVSPHEHLGRQGMTTMHNPGIQPPQPSTASLSPRHHQQEFETAPISGPVYHSLEPSIDVLVNHDGSVTELKDGSSPVQAFKTADLSVDSDNSLTPGFPVCSGDYAEISTGESGSGTVPKSKLKPRRRVHNDCSSDFTGDSDYPQVEDCTDNSSTTAYAESDWTGGEDPTSGGGRTFMGNPTCNGTSLPRGSGSSNTCSSHTSTQSYNSGVPNGFIPNGGVPVSNGIIYPHVPAGSSHTVPAVVGSSEIANIAGPASLTISAPRNHYKKLDPSTLEPNLKYTRLNVGKQSVV